MGAAAAKPIVTKVEPPNWWTGYSLNPVRVLVYGTGLSGATVTPAPGLRVGSVATSDNGTYLFVSVTIPPATSAGDYPFQIRTRSGAVTAPFRVDTPLAPAGRFQGFSPDDVIYLIMPDRFANGDTSNDDPSISHGLYNRQDPHSYHGGDLQGVIDHLSYLKDLGVTALWLTPVYDNNNHLTGDPYSSGKLITDYHGYGAVDYYGIEEHFGNLALLRKLVNDAHAMGIKVIQDQVANHVGPTHPWVNDPPTPTWFHGTASHHLKETFNLWDLIDPHASRELVRPVLEGWFADILPDLNQEDPEVAKYEIQNALWWIGTIGFDGIRQDTLPYVAKPFWAQWSAALKQQYPKLRVVGEVMDPNPVITSSFQAGGKKDGLNTGIDTVFDYPAYYSLRNAFARGGTLDTLIKTLASDRLYPNAASLVTIFGDHDVPRFLSEPKATVQSLKLAITFVLTARGTPVIYYGDEVGMKGGEDPDNRRDFPGGWAGDSHNAFSKEGRTAQESEIFNFFRKLTHLRQNLEPLRRGEMISLAETSQTWVYARRGKSGTVVVALNNGADAADMTIRIGGQNDVFRSLLGTTDNLVLRDGTGSIHLATLSAEIYTNSFARLR